jgi:hypothetical protein
MKSTVAALAAAALLPLPLTSTTAQADTTPSIDVTTTRATAYGDRYWEPSVQRWRLSKPYFPVTATVVCPTGSTGEMRVSPIWSMTSPTTGPFTCTGQPLSVTYRSAAAMPAELGRHLVTVSATLWVDSSPVVSDTQTVAVVSKARNPGGGASGRAVT